ncbi:MAG TPA: response regulator transcription factor [Candidatus Acidoferrales bacterium]|nr:response regulator transcription factor [Candidatus Acidoferrales bacterium]
MAKILIADDNDWVHRALSALLAAQNWSVVGRAKSGLQAIAMAEEAGASASGGLDLAILDIAMPEMDGLHAAAEILKKIPDLPIIAYTFHKSDALELEAKKTGIREVISKGDPPEMLIQTIRELLGRSSGISTTPDVQNSSNTSPPAETAATSESPGPDETENPSEASAKA